MQWFLKVVVLEQNGIFIHIFVCMYICAAIHAYIRTYIPTYECTYGRTNVCVCPLEHKFHE